MDTSQLRICFLEVLRNLNRNGVNQLVNLYNAIEQEAISRGFISTTSNRVPQLERADEDRIRELFWQFIIQGILVPGLNASNSNLPFFSLTEYGKSVISSPDPIPYDPDGYLDHLKSIAPNLDSIAMTYVAEGLDCFARGNYTASTVMLGVGSEALILVLAEALQQALPAAEATKMQESIEKDKVAKIYLEFKKHLIPHINMLTPILKDGLELLLDGVFTIIRIHRNEAGHPTGKCFDRLTVLGLFSVFPFYCERVSQLIEYLRNSSL